MFLSPRYAQHAAKFLNNLYHFSTIANHQVTFKVSVTYLKGDSFNPALYPIFSNKELNSFVKSTLTEAITEIAPQYSEIRIEQKDTYYAGEIPNNNS